MKRKPEIVDNPEQDIAGLPVAYAVVATLLALWMSFWGPSTSLPSLRFQEPWRITNSFEPPDLAVPFGESSIFVVGQGFARLLHASSTDSRSVLKDSSKVITAELSRASLLGKTRVAKGRNVQLGVSSSQGAIVVTESRVIIGLQVDNGRDLLKVWETSLPSLEVQAIAALEKVQQYLLLGRTEADVDAEFVLTALDMASGAVQWEIPLGQNDTVFPPRAIRSFPVCVRDIAIRPWSANGRSSQILAQWGTGAQILELANDQPPRLITSSMRDVVSVLDSPSDEIPTIWADLDGDGVPEDISVGQSRRSGCIHVRSMIPVPLTLFNNCTEADDVSLDHDMSGPNRIHASVLRRDIVHSGATSLLGNFSLHRPSQRGSGLILYNPNYGTVVCLGANGTLLWQTSTGLLAGDDGRINQRLFVVTFKKGQQDDAIVHLDSYGSDINSYLLVIGSNEVVLLKAVDGTAHSVFKFSSPIQSQPLFKDGKMVFVLESGEIVRLSLKTARDFAPPLILIPTMLLLSSLWACVMWRRLEEV